MKTRLKLIFIVAFLMGFSYLLGSFEANYRWLSAYSLDTMASGEQNSAKYSLVYMEKYMEGDYQGAHDWIETHSISNPEWIIENSSNDEYIFDALDMVFSSSDDNLMIRNKKLRIDDMRGIEKRQRVIRDYIDEKESE